MLLQVVCFGLTLHIVDVQPGYSQYSYAYIMMNGVVCLYCQLTSLSARCYYICSRDPVSDFEYDTWKERISQFNERNKPANDVAIRLALEDD